MRQQLRLSAVPSLKPSELHAKQRVRESGPFVRGGFSYRLSKGFLGRRE